MRYFTLLIILLLSAESFTQVTTFRIHPSDTNQLEPSIVRHPMNHQILFASAYTIKNSYRSEGVYVTTNGGVSWYGIDKLTGGSITTHGGDPGPIIDKNGVFIMTHQGSLTTGMYTNYSTDMGMSWSNTILIQSGDQDKGSPATDDNPASPYYGRTYLTWSRFSSPFPAVISYTTNSGQNWTPMIPINSSIPGHVSLGSTITVGLNGEVYVAWAAALQNSPNNENFIGFGKSTNGGVSWAAQEQAIDINGIKTAQLLPWNIRVNSYPGIDVDRSGGPRNGWIYIVTTEKQFGPAGNDPDVVLFRSTDGGNTWNSGVRVNQDPINNGEVQYFPAIEVDDGGGINIVYYDTRESPLDSMGVFLSRSTNGGDTWTDLRLNDHWFYPKAVAGTGGGNQGDNIGIVSAGNKVYPVWMSNFTGIYQIWSAIIEIPIGIKKISNELPTSFNLSQNYPNPFNPNSKIQFTIPAEKSGVIHLKVFNVLGKEIETLVNENLSPGIYETEFNGIHHPSGIYYYSLFADNKLIATRKMVLIK